MSAYNWLSEKIILPAGDLLLHTTIAEKLHFLMQSQYMSYNELQAFQDDRLKGMIRHAYENVPFYNNLFKQLKLRPADIKSKTDLHKLPVITKKDLRKFHPVQYLAGNLSPRKFIRFNSSGSTGEPLQYFCSGESYSMNYASAIRGWYWMGYRLGDTYAKLSQNPRQGLFKKIQDRANRSYYIFIRDLTKPNLLKTIAELNRTRPQFIRCYPDPLYFMARLMLAGEKLAYKPKAINSTGNILTPDMRKTIELAFDTVVYDSYSCESSAQFFESPGREAYLASMEYAITEVLDEQGNEANVGRHVTTDLWNMAMPFIRYDTQDIIVKSVTPPSAPRKLEHFSQIWGRDTDILVTPSGKLLIVHTFTIFFEYFEQVEQFQVIQPRADLFQVLLRVTVNFSSETENNIRNGLAQLVGNDVRIDIEIVSDIPLLKSGKRKFLVRAGDIKLPAYA